MLKVSLAFKFANHYLKITNFSFLLDLIFINLKYLNLLINFHFVQICMENFFNLLLICLLLVFLVFLILHSCLSFSFKEEDHQILSRCYYSIRKNSSFDNFFNYSFKFIVKLESEILFLNYNLYSHYLQVNDL